MDASQVFWFLMPTVLVGLFLHRKKITLELGIIYGAIMLLFILPTAGVLLRNMIQIHFLAMDVAGIGIVVFWVFKWLKIAMKGWMIVARVAVTIVVMMLLWIFLF